MPLIAHLQPRFILAALGWLGLLLTPNLLFVWVADERLDALIRTLPPAIALLAALLAWSRRPGWLLWLLAPFYLLLPFELYYIAAYGHPSSAHILAVISESNASEANEYLGLPRLLALGGAGLALGTIAIWLGARAPRLPRSRAVRWLAWASLIPFGQYAWLEWAWSQDKAAFEASGPVSSLEALMTTEIATPTGAMLSDSYPLGVFFRVRDFWGERQRLREAAARIQSFDYRPTRAQVPSAPEVYVLVIGESSTASHWQLNGYERATNPRLSQVTGLVSFRNVVTPFPATRLAVPVILTGAQESQSHRAPLGQASLATLFRQAGFTTYWLSNQAPLGLHDSIIAVHAYEADYTLYTNADDHTGRGQDDGALLPPFRRFLAEPGARKFFVVHLMGSHRAYTKRYPSAFAYFQPTESGDGVDAYTAERNAYDNSIRYTDHVLAEMIAALEADPERHAALLYLSDHGETMPSAACGETGHGRNNEDDYRVSALLWLSPAYRAAHPDVLPQAQARQDAPLYSPGAFHTLAELAGIRHITQQPQASWISPLWQAAPRWTNTVPDFDRALRIPPCSKLKMP